MPKDELIGRVRDWCKLRVRVRAKRSKSDPEKLVTPGVVFCRKSLEGASGFIIALGWWDWSISLSVARALRATERGEAGR